MDLRRVALFFTLSLLGIYLYSQLVHKLYGERGGTGVTREIGEIERRQERPEVARPVEPPPRPVEVAAPLPLGRSVVVETDMFRAEWRTTGARLERLYLKNYRTAVGADSPQLELIGSGRNQELPLGVEILPLRFDDTGVEYGADRDFLSLTGEELGKIVFSGRGPNGEEIEKEIDFRGNAYLMDLSVRARKGLVEGIAAKAVVRLTREMERDSGKGGGWFGGGAQGNTTSVVVLNGRRLRQEAVEKLEKGPLEFTEPIWGGFADQYFVGLALTGGEPGARIVARDGREGGAAVVGIEMPMVGEPPEARMKLYFGPKDIDILGAAAPALERAVDFGMFWFIALPLLRLIKLVHVATGNYGLDIILVSTLIKVLFLPLTKKSMVSMQAMQKLQPEMAKLRERYKDDSQRLQKEMMELYRRHRVNPLSGCLPMLLQLPVFIGLYNTLLNAIELRHAPFTLWVTDLSSPERLVIAGQPIPMLAIAMGVSMLVQQWMTPAAGDPTQRRMMMLMPVMFTFMFINFPSGLVLYWLVNNLLTIAQQYVLVKPRGNNREQRDANRRSGGNNNR